MIALFHLRNKRSYVLGGVFLSFIILILLIFTQLYFVNLIRGVQAKEIISNIRNDLIVGDRKKVFRHLSARIGDDSDFKGIVFYDANLDEQIIIGDRYGDDFEQFSNHFLYSSFSESIYFDLSKTEKLGTFYFYYYNWVNGRFFFLFWIIFNIICVIVLYNQYRLSKRQFEREIEFKTANTIAQTTQMLAHDVRKPFTLVSALIETVGTAKNTHHIQRILKESIIDISASLDSVNGMIQDVIEVGRIGHELRVEPESINRMLDNALKNLFRFQNKDDIYIEYRPNHTHKVRVNRLKVSRVFSNIIGNAIEHMGRQGGKLWFSTNESEKFIEVCIGNSNTYVSDEERKKLFEAFYTKGKIGGTGLGLAIAKKVIKAHGGEIYCKSSKAKGTEFFFTLPRADDIDYHNVDFLKTAHEYYKAGMIKVEIDDTRDITQSDEMKLEEKVIETNILEVIDKPLNIAIIDDEAIYRKHLLSHINLQIKLAEKIHVIEYKSVEDFHEELFRHEFDVVIIDVDLGKGRMNGFEMVPAIRQYMSEAIICVHSNRGALEFQAQALNFGANMFLPKPMNRLHLLKIMASALNISDQDRQVPVETRPSFHLPGKLVLVEDSMILAAAWKNLFEGESGCDVFTSFKEFCDKTRAPQYFENVFTVVTDYYLDDGFTGLDVAKHMREVAPQIPIFLCSSDEELFNEVFNGVLPKLPSAALEALQKFNRKS